MHLAFNDVKLLACLVRQTVPQLLCPHKLCRLWRTQRRTAFYTHTHVHRTYLSIFIRTSFSLLTFPNGFHVGCACVFEPGSIREFRVNLRPQRIIEFFHFILRIYFKLYLYFFFGIIFGWVCASFNEQLWWNQLTNIIAHFKEMFLE